MLVLKPGLPTQGIPNAIVYTDYENISELLRQYGQEPLGVFKTIKSRLRESNLNIIEFIVYANFEKTSLGPKQQTQLKALGFETRQASKDSMNSGDLELTVDAARTLYKYPDIHVFVLISSDRDIIPLLNAIKCENRFSYLISTRSGFNQIAPGYADFHEYIEDIFNLNHLVK